MPGPKTIEDFWELVNKTDDCWFFTGSQYSNGYGRFGYEGKRESAHRISYRIHKGTIPDGLFVCHTCDIRNCVNPNHLFLGTCKENLQDMVNKGRNYNGGKQGIKNSKAKLTEREVLEMRKEYTTKKESFKKIAIKYGVSETTVTEAIKGITWCHL